MSETETKTVKVTLELPKNIHNFLNDFSQFSNTTIEDLLKAELEDTIKEFYQGGFLEKWIKKAFKSRGVSDYFQVPA